MIEELIAMYRSGELPRGYFFVILARLITEGRSSVLESVSDDELDSFRSWLQTDVLREGYMLIAAEIGEIFSDDERHALTEWLSQHGT